MRSGYIIIFTTCGSRGEAEVIANSLLKKHLVACANIIPAVQSSFWWKGKIDKAKEALAILKAKSENFKHIEKAIRRLHSYDLPEIIAIPIVKGSKEYFNWIDANAWNP